MDEFSLITSEQELPNDNMEVVRDSSPLSDELSLISDDEEFQLISSDNEELHEEYDEFEVENTTPRKSDGDFTNFNYCAMASSSGSSDALETDENDLGLNPDNESQGLSNMERKS